MSNAPDPLSKLTAPEGWGRLGLGTGTLASLGRSSTVADTRALLDSMLDLGIPMIDTADSYASGDCEHLLAKALSGRRDRFALITKAGYRHGNLPGALRPLNQFVKKGLQKLGYRQCFDPAYLMRCLENSLRRLHTDHVEGFLLHDPPAGAAGSDETAELLRRIRDQGKALAVGVSSGEPEVLRVALENGICILIESPANIGVSDELTGIWQTCADRGIHVIGNHVFDPRSVAMEGMTHQILMRASASLLPPGSTILCGTRNPSHLRLSHAWACDPLPIEETRRLRSLRLG
jgi:aryl-alcohol dehydrogenase-like predicted oxidoreductase